MSRDSPYGDTPGTFLFIDFMSICFNRNSIPNDSSSFYMTIVHSKNYVIHCFKLFNGLLTILFFVLFDSSHPFCLRRVLFVYGVCFFLKCCFSLFELFWNFYIVCCVVYCILFSRWCFILWFSFGLCGLGCLDFLWYVFDFWYVFRFVSKCCV